MTPYSIIRTASLHTILSATDAVLWLPDTKCNLLVMYLDIKHHNTNSDGDMLNCYENVLGMCYIITKLHINIP